MADKYQSWDLNPSGPGSELVAVPLPHPAFTSMPDSECRGERIVATKSQLFTASLLSQGSSKYPGKAHFLNGL